MRAVLKIGGSLLYSDESQVLIDRVKKYAEVVTSLARNGHQMIVVVGGGKPARAFINAARELGASESQCDWLGIRLARNNAELLLIALGGIAYPNIVEDFEELETALCTGKVILMGGVTPGQSTNAVAAIAAETMNADRLYNATDVDGVYDRDPDEPNATKFDEISIEKLNSILTGTGTRAGEYRLFDPVAIRVVGRSRIETVIFNGTDPENLARLVKGKKLGTKIVHKSNK